jgi:hypothetical protein
LLADKVRSVRTVRTAPRASSGELCFGVQFWLFSIRRVEVKRFQAIGVFDV